MADLPRLSGPQWAALERINARYPDAGPKPLFVHRSTMAALVKMGFVAEVRREAPLGQPDPPVRYARTVDGQAAINRLNAERAGLSLAPRAAEVA